MDTDNMEDDENPKFDEDTEMVTPSHRLYKSLFTSKKSVCGQKTVQNF